MQNLFAEIERKETCRKWGLRHGIVPRPYQEKAFVGALKLNDQENLPGSLLRVFTGGGKTLIAAIIAKDWLNRSRNHRVGVLSYEQTLVDQFAGEMEDFLGITPGIEMGESEIKAGDIPRIVVASRQTLMPHEPCTLEQRDEFRKYGIPDVGLYPKPLGIRLLSRLQNGMSREEAAARVREANESVRANHEIREETGLPWGYSRLWKLDWRFNWLWFFDEAHKYSFGHKTTNTLVSWFDRNTNSRRLGLTATPKRGDGISLGTKLFPGIAIDMPLTEGVRDGWAVPYEQRFIVVEGVDFAKLHEQCKGSTEKLDEEFSKHVETEEQLEKICGPTLREVAERKTLIFTGSVESAKAVANFINARVPCECSCGTKLWAAKRLIGDGAKCGSCGSFLESSNVTAASPMARWLDGSVPREKRNEVYTDYAEGKFQFLVVCGLCREGFNDRGIGAVAIYRPVSRKASSLAEQMKGRGCRPLAGLVDGLSSAAERIAAIAASAKPNCLIIDLVGVSGMENYASTVQIYADGVPDEIVAIAEQIALTGGIPDPMQCLAMAKRQDAEAKEKARLAREEADRRAMEEAERRATFGATATYSVHGSGRVEHQKGQPTEGQFKLLKFLGMEFTTGWMPSRKQANRLISLLKDEGKSPSDAAYECGIKVNQWDAVRASVKQQRYMRQMGIRDAANMTPHQASEAIDKKKNPHKYPDDPTVVNAAKAVIARSRSEAELTATAKKLAGERTFMSPKDWEIVKAAGQAKREAIRREASGDSQEEF